MNKLSEYIQKYKEKQEFDMLISQIDNCCLWKANSKNESLISWIRAMKLFRMSDEAISVAMVLVKNNDA